MKFHAIILIAGLSLCGCDNDTKKPVSTPAPPVVPSATETPEPVVRSSQPSAQATEEELKRQLEKEVRQILDTQFQKWLNGQKTEGAFIPIESILGAKLLDYEIKGVIATSTASANTTSIVELESSRGQPIKRQIRHTFIKLDADKWYIGPGPD